MIPNGNSLEYVASGMGHSYINFDFGYQGGSKEFIKDCIKKLDNAAEHHHRFSMLFNAIKESHFGPRFKEAYLPVMKDVYADSGGLQIITCGHELTPQLKERSYRKQAKGATLGMCFDEIPVKVIGVAHRMGMTGRVFDRDVLEERARATGKNIVDQLRYFEKQMAETGVIAIMQGNDYDTYMRWCEYLIDEVPEELRPRIRGIAMGAAALGQGVLEDIKRGYYYSQLPWKPANNHFHILGVGSFERLLPYLAFSHSGVFKDTHVSYDSTSHTCGVSMGRYVFNGDLTGSDTGEIFNPTWTRMLEDVTANFPELGEYDPREYHRILRMTCKQYERLGNDINVSLRAITTTIWSSILNFERAVGRAAVDRSVLIADASDNLSGPLKTLLDVKTKQDMDRWLRDVGKFVYSLPVQDRVVPKINSFFELEDAA